MTATPIDPFVPLTAAPDTRGERQEFRATVIPKPAKTRPFHTLVATSPAAPAGAATRPGCEPRVSVQRDGDRVSSIRIQCSCGQVIDLACVY